MSNELMTEGSLFSTPSQGPTEREKEFFQQLLALCEDYDVEIEYDHPLSAGRGGSSFHTRDHEWCELRVMHGKLNASVSNSDVKIDIEDE